MDYPTVFTSWPSPEPSSDAKSLISLFFTLADSRDSNAGDRLAKEVFTRDGEFILSQGKFQGSLEIATSRQDAWITIKTRHHTVLKVYANNTDDIADFILIGSLDATTVDEQQMHSQFVARMLIQRTESGPRVRQYRVIAATGKDILPYLEDP